MVQDSSKEELCKIGKRVEVSEVETYEGEGCMELWRIVKVYDIRRHVEGEGM